MIRATVEQVTKTAEGGERIESSGYLEITAVKKNSFGRFDYRVAAKTQPPFEGPLPEDYAAGQLSIEADGVVHAQVLGFDRARGVYALVEAALTACGYGRRR